MKPTSEPPKRTNGNNDLHEATKTKSQCLPSYLIPRPSIEDQPTNPNHAMSSRRYLVLPPEINRLPPQPMTTSLHPQPAGWEDRKMWLHAKIEEERRRQEEEKTHRAKVVLEQRRIEQSILSDALDAGVPPNMVPLIFNGIYTTGANLQLAAELQRQWSAPSAMPQPQNNPGPASSARLPVAPQPPQQGPRQPPRAQASELPPTVSNHLRETRHTWWSEAMSNSHRARVINSEREQLRRKLIAQNVEFADKDLLDTAFEHTFPVTSSMVQAHPSRYWASPSDKTSRSQEKRQQAPQKAHPMVSQESGRLQLINTASVTNVPSHVHPEQTNSLSPKRKDQRSHEKVPPPKHRQNETLCCEQDLSDAVHVSSPVEDTIVSIKLE
ncbi:hypothetical protein CBS147333_6753 [Penicillium roqueforti]|nr:hypothetical protein CBS147372_2186 [Penicillium roqueforti]KAI3106191.1 hypothetical protein CBS147333_6753 [Penicillium roqueforti]KAI3157271.1 hypothetical protein CBS147317_5010 [Penicillium roqueforti]KAI3177142.1 hypothetical protein DTO039G3_501 [Penicillium roqueforti]KAI3237082.1 hypothetical protein CBS147310_2963 [Penicillium roqueforti]